MTDARNSLTLSRKIIHVFKNVLDHLNGLCLTFLKLINFLKIFDGFYFYSSFRLQKNYVDSTGFPSVPFLISLSLIHIHRFFLLLISCINAAHLFMVGNNW